MKKTPLVSLLSALLVLCLLTGCGAKSADSVAYADLKMESAPQEVNTSAAMDAEEAEMDAGSGSMGLVGNVIGRKIIKNAELSVETRDFDGFTSTLNAIVGELGGYVQSSSQGTKRRTGLRYADMTLRIPAEKLEIFISRTEGAATVTYRNIYTDDVTLSYVDTESHLKALRTEQDALLALLEKAESVEDLITIQSRLSEVRYEIESYESRLRTYDDQIDYSTVYLNLEEVERESQVTPETAGEEISRRLSENWQDLGEGLRRFGIDFVSSLPYILIVVVPMGIAVLVFVLIVKSYRRRHPKRNLIITAAPEKKAEEKAEEKKEK